jgi:hypothetical protein
MKNAFLIFCASLVAAITAHGEPNAEALDKYLGSYKSSTLKSPHDRPYGIFFKESVESGVPGKTYGHYVFLSSPNPLPSREVALKDVGARMSTEDFYLDENGNFFQYWSFGNYKEPGKLAGIDQDLARPGYDCSWQKIPGASPAAINMDYCGDQTLDAFTFNNGVLHIKQTDSEQGSDGSIRAVTLVDQDFVKVEAPTFIQSLTRGSNKFSCSCHALDTSNPYFERVCNALAVGTTCDRVGDIICIPKCE